MGTNSSINPWRSIYFHELWVGAHRDAVFYLSCRILAHTCFYGFGYVLAFAGIFGGEWKYLWTGASIIAVMILLGKFALKRKRQSAD